MPENIQSNVRARSLDRARFAFDSINLRVNGKNPDGAVDNSKRLSPSELKELRSHIKDVPMMIKTNGLAAAYAFMFSKAKRAPQGASAEQLKKEKKDYVAIEDISKEWLRQQNVLQPVAADFYEQLIKQDIAHYRRATREILALFTWLKRYADGMIN